MEFKKRKIGPLDALCAGPLENSKLVVLCHGFGAPGDDLASLATVLPQVKKLSYLFPEAPLRLPPLLGGGRAWWNIDFAARQEQMVRDGGLDMSKDSPEGLESARKGFDGFIAECLSSGGGPKEIIVGGFSQGAMVTMDWALRTQVELKGVIQWSTTYLCEDQWKPAIATLKPPVLQSHGRVDPILPFAMAEKLAGELKSVNSESQFIEFNGPHTIPESALQSSQVFIKQWLDL